MRANTYFDPKSATFPGSGRGAAVLHTAATLVRPFSGVQVAGFKLYFSAEKEKWPL